MRPERLAITVLALLVGIVLVPDTARAKTQEIPLCATEQSSTVCYSAFDPHDCYTESNGVTYCRTLTFYKWET